MKLIVAGATGFVASEVIRQALRIPAVTEIVALSRTKISSPDNAYPGSDGRKLKSVIVTEYDVYSKEVKAELAGADACIWTVAVTPAKSKKYSADELKRICVTGAQVGLQTILAGRDDKSTPLRYCGISGWAVDRDLSKRPTFMPEYTLMRAEAENVVIDLAAQHKEQIEATIARPGLIKSAGDWKKWAIAPVLKLIVGLPSVDVTEISAALLDQCMNGITSDPLLNEQLVEIGQAAFKAQNASMLARTTLG